jgi:hypothetical protein
MEVLGIIGLIILGLIVFVGLGLLGWVLKLLGYVLEFLWDGCSTTIGCLFWVFIIIIVLMAI